MSAIVYVKPNC